MVLSDPVSRAVFAAGLSSARSSGAGPHAAQRPAWTCQSCGEAWPCLPARKQLVAAFTTDPWGLPELALHLMDQASGELRYVDRVGRLCLLPWPLLYRRFVGWTWPLEQVPPAGVPVRVALHWVVNPANRRAVLLVRRYGPLEALRRLLAADDCGAPSPVRHLRSVRGVRP